jgi:hypothetical protein
MRTPNVIAGAVAGAAATAVLNATTYTDMAVRGRPPSTLPSRMAERFAQKLGITLDDNQKSGAGMLLGYVDGFGAGTAFSLARSMCPDVPALWAGIALGLATMAMSEGTATAMGETNPATWPASAWISGLIPRFMYGWTACLIYDHFAGE